jgi:co-chaperonin GroES (HSP10)
MADRIRQAFDGLTLKGSSLIIQPTREEKGETKTESGIVLPGEIGDAVKLNRGTVIRAGEGYENEAGVWIENPVKEGAVVVYRAAQEYELDGIKFYGTEIGQIVAYRNR